MCITCETIIFLLGERLEEITFPLVSLRVLLLRNTRGFLDHRSILHRPSIITVLTFSGIILQLLSMETAMAAGKQTEVGVILRGENHTLQGE